MSVWRGLDQELKTARDKGTKIWTHDDHGRVLNNWIRI